MYPANTSYAKHSAAVIVHYLHAELTSRCLQSLLNHCPGLSAIYVIDNSPEDPSFKQLQNEFNDSRLHWLPQPQNLGFGEGCNVGIQAALTDSADAVMLINNDAWVNTDIVSQFEKASQQLDHKAILTGLIYSASESDDPSPEIWYAGGHASLYSVRTYHHQQRPEQAGPTDFICGCLMWLPADVLRQIKGFDPRYFLYLEDLELCLRAKEQNIKLIFLPEIEIFHQVSSSTGGKQNPMSVYYQNRNRILLLLQHGKCQHWLVFPWIYVLGFIKRGLGKSLSASWQALKDALKGHWGQKPGDI